MMSYWVHILLGTCYVLLGTDLIRYNMMSYWVHILLGTCYVLLGTYLIRYNMICLIGYISY